MLTLPIIREYFDMILSGEKKEEYRDNTPYYKARFRRTMGYATVVRFRNGYSKKSRTVECNIIPRIGGGRPEWGAEPDKEYIVLKILSVKEVLADE